ncbi:MAG: hypothetical protein AAFN30_20245, partial [Actinomycetota bacterium]
HCPTRRRSAWPDRRRRSGCSTTAVDRFWCPAYRETSISGGVEYVGIYVQTRHTFITGFFGGGRTLTDTTILRLEPDSA